MINKLVIYIWSLLQAQDILKYMQKQFNYIYYEANVDVDITFLLQPNLLVITNLISFEFKLKYTIIL